MSDPAKTPVSFRGAGFVPGTRRWAPWLAFALIIACWESASRLGWLPSLFMPAPSEVMNALHALLVDGKLLVHIGASLKRIVSGWILGSIAGVTLGFLMGIFVLARSVGLPVVSALFPIPKIALLPLFILWFGIGEPSKVATIALGVFFPTVVSAFSAVDNVPRNLIRMAQSFGLSTRMIVFKVILPGAMPGILAGFRISTSIALILVVAAEMIGADTGIGAFVLAAGNLMQIDQLIAGVVLLSLLGLTVSALLSVTEKIVLRWR
ncbi:MAG: ABC transporter permease [Ferrovibrio sp.]|uniref:ABC transporter permease n=1 Tax=Ferrovibrio sp. TaxID=1917215 RepID=UPI002618B9E1|nr:ABC transporter permease [Ferrovibrio sp.]MCW0235905.1 ABC transporter permease [Ferrovibrio sp.]